MNWLKNNKNKVISWTVYTINGILSILGTLLSSNCMVILFASILISLSWAVIQYIKTKSLPIYDILGIIASIGANPISGWLGIVTSLLLGALCTKWGCENNDT